MSPRGRVLVLAYYFPPLGGGGVNRTLKVVGALEAAGFAPLVLTVDDAAWPRDPELLEAVPPRTRVIRLPNPDWGRVPARAGATPEAGRGRGRLRRWLVPDLHVGWSALAACFAAGLARASDVRAVYTTCPPYSAHAGGWLARRLGVPWVADFRDAWTLYDGRQDFPRWRKAVERRLEEAVLRGADRVLFASEGVRQRYLGRVPDLDRRSETVLTGFDPAESAAAEAIRPGPGPLSLVHAGRALQDRKAPTFHRLLDALARWQRRDAAVSQVVEVSFVGAEAGVAAAIERAGLSAWVRVEEALPRAALPERLARAHRCLYLAPFGASAADPVPGKLFDAAGAGRRLLALAPRGAVTQLIEGLDLGEWADPREPEQVLARLASLDGERSGGPRPPGARGRAALDARASMARVVAAVEAVVAPARSSRHGRVSAAGERGERRRAVEGQGVPCP